MIRMKKLINKTMENIIVCDKCHYSIPYTEDAEKNIHQFIDQECPDCGANLLRMEDYIKFKRLVKMINIINRWFSWLTIFKTKESGKDSTFMEVKVYDGINIKIKD